MIKSQTALEQRAITVLRNNNLGGYTKPAPALYPHQWLWDSCFIAIGLRHLDIKRAQQEILSLFRGQWSNGMLPHIVFTKATGYHAGPEKWQSLAEPEAPRDIETTGITQPPMVAEAIIRVGGMLPAEEQRSFYAEVFPKLLRYHEWLYRERDPKHTGLVTLIHSWESGLDNTPYWMRLTHEAAPLSVRTLQHLGQADKLDLLRQDKRHVPSNERLSAADLFTLYHLAKRLQGQHYKLSALERYRIPLVQDLTFNAILIRANQHLETMARVLGQEIPRELHNSIQTAKTAFEALYEDNQYWSRNYQTSQLIKEPTIATFLALYSGTISEKRANDLAANIQQPEFWPHYGIATVPMNSSYFKPRCYWQGPVWVNMNWLIADGLNRYGHIGLAQKLRDQTLELIDHGQGMFEYYSPLDGSGAGTDNFSWTAALTIDLLAQRY